MGAINTRSNVAHQTSPHLGQDSHRVVLPRIFTTAAARSGEAGSVGWLTHNALLFCSLRRAPESETYVVKTCSATPRSSVSCRCSVMSLSYAVTFISPLPSRGSLRTREHRFMLVRNGSSDRTKTVFREDKTRPRLLAQDTSACVFVHFVLYSMPIATSSLP